MTYAKSQFTYSQIRYTIHLIFLAYVSFFWLYCALKLNWFVVDFHRNSGYPALFSTNFFLFLSTRWRAVRVF